ncbi:hypothetical protein [Roseococcus sp. YIM B11640]|uniref:hypothetical protein n=1 Tax=Roseococcus sp. YIM B11640 TaxID=3133973 RepID=UPI003C79C91E
MQGSQGQPRAVIVHAAREVAVVLECAGARPVALLSAPGAAAYIGVVGFRALVEAHGALSLAILDAADAPGHALAAMRAGFGAVVLSPAVPAFAGVARIALGSGVRLLPKAPPALDLARVDLAKPQGLRHLESWLALPDP